MRLMRVFMRVSVDVDLPELTTLETMKAARDFLDENLPDSNDDVKNLRIEVDDAVEVRDSVLKLR